jgi:EmrB/QacA subfamily drug resistance transporter
LSRFERGIAVINLKPPNSASIPKTQAALAPKLQRLALVNVCLGQFITALDSRSVIVALPTISIHFDGALAAVQWIPLAYQLTVIGFVLSMARFGDMLGRRRIYTLGFLLLAVGSAASGVSTGLWQLIAFRVLAGIGGAMALANGRAIVSTLYAQEGRGRALGMTSMAFHLGYVTGPSLGGFLIDTVGWRWIFFGNLPVAAAAAFMAWKVLPETVSDKEKYSMDLLGMMTLLLTAVTLIAGLQQVAKSGVTWVALLVFLVAVIFLRLLLHFERKSPAPLLDLSLFRVRMLTAGILSNLFIVISHSSTFFLLPFYLQGILHFTPTQVGVTIIFFSLVIVFLAPVGGWLGDRLGSRVLCTAGAALSVISMLALSRLGADARPVAVMIPLMILGLGWSLFQAPNLSSIFSAVEPRYIGAVSGMSLTSANIANAMGVAIGSVLFLRWLNYYGLSGSVVPAYTKWGENPVIFIKAFQNSWLFIAGLTAIAIVTSAMRGVDQRRRGN